MPVPRKAPSRRAAPRILAALLASLLALGAPPPALAGGGTTTKILEQCSEGKIPRGYSVRAYERALKQMEAQLSEYTDCADLIHKAELAVATGGRSGGPGAGAPSSTAAVAPPSPTEQHALERATHSGGSPVAVGGEAIHPGVVHVDIASAISALPTPLLALLAFGLGGALLIVGRAAYRRMRRSVGGF